MTTDWQTEFKGFGESYKAVRAATSRADFGHVHFAILMRLGTDPGATPGQIAAEFDLKPDTTSKILKSLKSADYAIDIASDDDRRVRHVYLTKSGAKVLLTYLHNRGFDITDRVFKVASPGRAKITGGEG